MNSQFATWWAKHFAGKPGVSLSGSLTPEEVWIASGSHGFCFVQAEDRDRRCALCGKRIPAGELYYGMGPLSETLFGGTHVRSTVKRLHARCAQELPH
jgi:hypothetical protein